MKWLRSLLTGQPLDRSLKGQDLRLYYEHAGKSWKNAIFTALVDLISQTGASPSRLVDISSLANACERSIISGLGDPTQPESLNLQCREIVPAFLRTRVPVVVPELEPKWYGTVKEIHYTSRPQSSQRSCQTPADGSCQHFC
jgi:hypothetical protein